MKKLIPLALLVSLSGCASMDMGFMDKAKTSETSTDRPSAAPVDMGVNWQWKVVGDASVKPVQVFTLKGSTYLQMKGAGDVVLLVNGEPIPYRPSYPYLIVQGEPDRIDIVADGYRAIAEHESSGHDAMAAESSNRAVERVSF